MCLNNPGHMTQMAAMPIYGSLNLFYCQFLSNGVGLQVLTTLITARPLQYIYNSKHGIRKHITKYIHVYNRQTDRQTEQTGRQATDSEGRKAWVR